MQRIITRGRPAALANTLHGKRLLGYLFAFVVFLVALYLRLELVGILPSGLPFITFLPAMLVVAFFAGAGPAIFGSVLSCGAAWYLYVLPTGNFAITVPVLLALAFYWVVITVGVSMISHLRRVALSLEQQPQANAELAEQRAFLFKELQHRVANNMAFLVAILSMQKSAVRDRPMDATTILDDAIRRIRLFSRIHRRLHDPDGVEASLESHFHGLFDDLVAATDADHIRCELDVEQIELPVEAAMTLSLIAAELMTNAIKHAFADRDAGVIRLSLKREGDCNVFQVADDGVGKAPDDGERPGLGTMIVDALCEQLHARRDAWIDHGTHVRLTFETEGATRHI